jgi:hypothetical protein
MEALKNFKNKNLTSNQTAFFINAHVRFLYFGAIKSNLMVKYSNSHAISQEIIFLVKSINQFS